MIRSAKKKPTAFQKCYFQIKLKKRVTAKVSGTELKGKQKIKAYKKKTKLKRTKSSRSGIKVLLISQIVRRLQISTLKKIRRYKKQAVKRRRKNAKRKTPTIVKLKRAMTCVADNTKKFPRWKTVKVRIISIFKAPRRKRNARKNVWTNEKLAGAKSNNLRERVNCNTQFQKSVNNDVTKSEQSLVQNLDLKCYGKRHNNKSAKIGQKNRPRSLFKEQAKIKNNTMGKTIIHCKTGKKKQPPRWKSVKSRIISTFKAPRFVGIKRKSMLKGQKIARAKSKYLRERKGSNTQIQRSVIQNQKSIQFKIQNPDLKRCDKQKYNKQFLKTGQKHKNVFKKQAKMKHITDDNTPITYKTGGENHSLRWKSRKARIVSTFKVLRYFKNIRKNVRNGNSLLKEYAKMKNNSKSKIIIKLETSASKQCPRWKLVKARVISTFKAPKCTKKKMKNVRRGKTLAKEHANMKNSSKGKITINYVTGSKNQTLKWKLVKARIISTLKAPKCVRNKTERMRKEKKLVETTNTNLWQTKGLDLQSQVTQNKELTPTSGRKQLVDTEAR